MIIIPCYQPDKVLIKLIEDIHVEFKEAQLLATKLVVINDGSDSQCDPIFEAISDLTTVIHHEKNLGKGMALKTGFQIAKENHEPFVVTVDADGQHKVADIRKVWDATQNHDHLVLGTRDFNKGVPLRSRVGNRLTSYLFKKRYGQKIRDTQTGLRGIPCDLLDTFLAIPYSRYEYEAACLISLPAGVSIFQVPIETIYQPGNPSSHFSPLLDSLRIYWILFRGGISSVTAGLVDILIFSLLFYLGVSTFNAVVFSRCCSVCVSYFLLKEFAFKSTQGHAKAGPKYLMLALANTFFTATVTSELDSLLEFNTQILYVLISMSLFIFNFFIQRRFIF